MQSPMRPDLPEEDEATFPALLLDRDDPDTIIHTRPLPELEDEAAPARALQAMPTLGMAGRYELKAHIGEGGAGTVYAAHDPLLCRLIAVKKVPEALLHNEIRAMGSLQHPHIVTLFDAGTGAEGGYIAMEWLRGKDLRQLLAMGWRPTVEQAVLIVRRVADAVAFAHHKGVIHLDLKPANIFMLGRTQPRVLDFGIARVKRPDLAAPKGPDLVGGSPYYMAPEQLQGGDVDRRADVYALGVVLYELLTGMRPFVGDELETIHRSVLAADARPPHEVVPGLSRELSNLVMQAMCVDPKVRTRSASLLSRQLRQWLVSQAAAPKASVEGATEASASGPGEKRPDARSRVRARAPVVRRWWLFGSGVALLVALAAWWGWQQSRLNTGGVAMPASASGQIDAQAPVTLRGPSR